MKDHSESERGCWNQDREQYEPERELDDLAQIVPEVERGERACDKGDGESLPGT
jgi:hypothetical protein